MTMTITPVTGAPDGIVRLWTDVDLADKEARKALRKAAAGLAHSLVGAPQNVKAAKLLGTPGTLADFAVITRGKREAAPSDPREAEIAALRAQLAALTGEAATPAPSKSDDFRERVIVPRAQARAAAKCQTCLDFGKVRSTPRVRKDGTSELHFRTANGAATSPTGVTCPACKGKAAKSA